MPITFKVKIGKMRSSLWITIPKEIGEALELKAGDTLALSVTDHELLAKKIP